MTTKNAGIIVTISFILAAGALIQPHAAPLLAQKKMEPEELIALHLESIGSAQARAARKTSRAQGLGRRQVLVGDKRLLEGEAYFVSEGMCYRSSMSFDVSDYPGEDIAFDGEKTYVKQINPGIRSKPGEFLYRYEVLLKEGLMGGTVSTAWPLLNLEARKPRLKYGGIKNSQGRDLHELDYRIRRGGSDFKITIYFEPETYRHIATIYELEIPETLTMIPDPTTSGAQRAADSPRQLTTRYALEESFDDFQPVGGLTLPFQWRVRFITETPGAQVGNVAAGNRDLSVVEWHFVFDTVNLNIPIDPKVFVPY